MKNNEDGSFKKCKARFVAKADYENVHKRVMLKLAAHYRVQPRQIDIKTACLNAGIDEDIYIEQSNVPQGRL